jgi:hypothetical protein
MELVLFFVCDYGYGVYTLHPAVHVPCACHGKRLLHNSVFDLSVFLRFVRR